MSELGKLNKKAGKELITHIRVLDHPVIGYMAVLDIQVAEPMMSRVWAVGTPMGMAAVSLDIFKAGVTLPDFWGDKARPPHEGIISLAAATSIQELIRRFHQAKPEDKFPYGSHSIMRGLYRAVPFIYSEIKDTLKEKNLEAAIVWRPENFNRNDHLLKLMHDAVLEERDGEHVYVVRV